MQKFSYFLTLSIVFHEMAGAVSPEEDYESLQICCRAAKSLDWLGTRTRGYNTQVILFMDTEFPYVML